MLELGKEYLAVSILRKHAPSHDFFVSRWVCLSRVSHVYCLISAILLMLCSFGKLTARKRRRLIITTKTKTKKNTKKEKENEEEEEKERTDKKEKKEKKE